MVRKRSNINASATNSFKLTSAGVYENVAKYKNTVTIATLTGFVFKGADGSTVTKTYSPAKTTWATIKEALEAALVEAGYVLDNGSEYGLKVVPDGSNFDIEIKGDVMVTSISSVSATVEPLASENQAPVGL